MKKSNLLSKAEMKKVMGGTEPDALCLALGEPCTGSVQCCSNVCKEDGSTTTGASCATAE